LKGHVGGKVEKMLADREFRQRIEGLKLNNIDIAGG
jgi:hypothetical protein